MSIVISDLLFWDQSVNISCGGMMECDALFELGPPPDMILNIPPPPVPPFMEEFMSRLSSEGITIDNEDTHDFPQDEKHCNLCQWAASGNGVGYVELAQKGPLIDDTWFLVIISTCVAATLLGVILAIGCLKYREGKMKPMNDAALAKKKALGLERCEAVLYPIPALNSTASSTDTRTTSRALWAGVKPLEGNHYTVDHCQPVEQKPARLDLLPDPNYDYADYSSVSYSSLTPAYGTAQDTIGINQMSPPKVSTPAASFENVGYVAGDETIGKSIMTTAPRAAFLLGFHKPCNSYSISHHHHYEMVTPRLGPMPRRHKSLDRSSPRSLPVISAPSGIPGVRLPPLNSRAAKYGLTALANGSHTLTPKIDNCSRRVARVCVDTAGHMSTCLAPASPADHIYASPITSPVI